MVADRIQKAAIYQLCSYMMLVHTAASFLKFLQAMGDAVETDIKTLLSQLPRDRWVHLPSPRKGDIAAACQGLHAYLGLAVEDMFALMLKTSVLSRRGASYGWSEVTCRYTNTNEFESSQKQIERKRQIQQVPEAKRVSNKRLIGNLNGKRKTDSFAINYNLLIIGE